MPENQTQKQSRSHSIAQPEKESRSLLKRRQILQQMLAGAAGIPLLRVRLSAADDLNGDHIAFLHEIAPTVLPSALGAKGTDDAVDAFVRWVRNYREGVPLSHGYGNPRLERSGPSPAPGYAKQIAALQDAARAKGGRFSTLPLDTRRAMLDEAFTAAAIQNLPGRPDGRHVVADLMAHYFRGSAANDLCYNARIGRNVNRAIVVTTMRPQPLGGRGL
jgi:hypothetical protein